MKTSHPPWLAAALLRRIEQENEPLAGDLLEGFAIRQSRLWLWRQVILALVMRLLQPPDPVRPIRLVEQPSFVAKEPAASGKSARRINLTGSPVEGVGGLGLIALGVLVTVARPQAWWMFVPAILGGVMLGVALLIIRRRALGSARHSGSVTLLREADELHPAD